LLPGIEVPLRGRATGSRTLAGCTVAVKVKCALDQVMKAWKGSRGIPRGGWSTPRPGRFTQGKRFSAHFIGSWEGLRAGLDDCVKSRPHRDSIPGPSSPYRVAIPAHNQ
jgi:hypothetical protein